MDYRTGKCSQCGAEYKVPASFAHNVARCKKCKGVVHLGAAAGAPAAAREPAPAPASIPAKRVVPKSEAPAAQRPPAPEARPATPSAPAPRPTPKPAAPSPAPDKGGTLERLKGERAPAAPAASAGTPRPVATGAARKGGGEAEPAREKRAGRGERGKPAREKKKAPMAGILAGAGLVLAAVVVFLFKDKLFGGGEAPPAAVTGVAPSEGTGAPGAATPAASETQREPAEAAPADAAPAAEEPKAAAKPEPKAKDPASIDLTAVPDFQPTPDTTPEEWAQMNEWMAQWMDVDAGAAGNRARLALIEKKRKAVPAILNFFKKQDFATKEGRSNGDQCQKSLEKISNGMNFDWKYVDEAAGRPVTHPDDVYFCKRVVQEWHKLWGQAEQDIRAWIRMAKLEEKDPAEAKRLLEELGGQIPEPTPGGDDDLEVD